MLVKRKITLVDQHQEFYYAGRTYVLATGEEKKKHPAKGMDGGQVLAYHHPEQQDRVPVTFNPLIEVYVQQK